MKKRKDGRYQKNIYIGRDENGKRKYKSVCGTSRKEVETLAAELKQKLGKGIAIKGQSGSGRQCKGGGLCKAPFYIDSAVVLSVTLQNLYISREECFLFLLYLGVYIKILNINTFKVFNL